MPKDFITQDLSEVNVIFIHSVLDEVGLTASQFRVYAHLARRSNQVGKAWPGIDSMARVCRLHKDTVIEIVKDLEKCHMILVQRRPGQGNVYRLTPPSEWHLSEIGNGKDQSEPVDAPVGNGERHQSEMGNERKSNEGNPQKDIQPARGAARGSRDNTPTSDAAIWLAELFGRKTTTKWSAKEIKAFKDAQPEFDNETRGIVSAYYKAEREKTDGIYRRDLPTFLNNALGEIERARAWANRFPAKAAAIQHKLENPKATGTSHKDILKSQAFAEWFSITYAKSPAEIPAQLSDSFLREYKEATTKKQLV